MPLHNDTTAIVTGCRVVWDGITRPERNEDGSFKYNLKVVIPPNCPDLPILEQLANNELAQGDFRGVWPAGGIWPMRPTDHTEFQGMYPGWICLNATTYNTPQVFDEQGQQLDPMQYGPLIYGNQQVNLLVHFKSYNNKSKGIAARLDGFQIVLSAQAQQASFGGVNAQQAFAGGGGAPAPQGPPGGYQQPPAPQGPPPGQAPAGVQYGPAPAPQPGGYGAPQGHQGPPTGGTGYPPQGQPAPGPAPQPGYGPPAGQPPAPQGQPGYQQPGQPGQAPQQAHPGQYMPPGYPQQ